MKSINSAMTEINNLSVLAGRNLWVNRIDARVKIIITICYIVLLTSLGKYDIAGVICMSVYVITGFSLCRLQFNRTLKRLWPAAVLISMFGVPDIFLDHTPVVLGRDIIITGGIVSFTTLIVKGFLTVLAAYILIASTTVEKICRALRQFKVPAVITTQVLLTYRYLDILTEQVRISAESYELRAPGQKGIRAYVWGPMLGQILIQSIDRAHELYESMLLSGFNGEFYDE